jgi:polyisoprenyl-teichoic acid--peptidoglycan teichoic acid transferase
LKKLLWVIVAGMLAAIIALVWFSWSPTRLKMAAAPTTAGAVIRHEKLPELPQLPSATLTQPTTILLMGTDVVYQRQQGHVQPEIGATNGNSDTMMLVFLDPVHNQLSILNIPRDTEAVVGKYGVRKINSANVLGGPELAKDTVTGLLHVPIDHYLVLNVQGLLPLVNEIGGLTIAVPKKMSYMDWTAKLKIDLEPGVHTLTGNQAMGFVRFRHDALGDIGRVQRQQLFMQAVMKKMTIPSSWLHVPALIDIGLKNINTDLSQMEMIQCLNFAHGVPKDKIRFVMLPGQFASNGDWIATTDGQEIAARFASADQDSVSSRADISVCIVNASSDRAAGRKIAQALSTLGYATSVAGDEKDAAAVTQIIAQNGNTSDAQMLQRDLGSIGTVVNASVGNLTSAITIIVHDDLDSGKIQLSSADVPRVGRRWPAKPIIVQTIEPPAPTETPVLTETSTSSPSAPVLNDTLPNSVPTSKEVSNTGSPDLRDAELNDRGGDTDSTKL